MTSQLPHRVSTPRLSVGRRSTAPGGTLPAALRVSTGEPSASGYIATINSPKDKGDPDRDASPEPGAGARCAPPKPVRVTCTERITSLGGRQCSVISVEDDGRGAGGGAPQSPQSKARKSRQSRSEQEEGKLSPHGVPYFTTQDNFIVSPKISPKEKRERGLPLTAADREREREERQEAELEKKRLKFPGFNVGGSRGTNKPKVEKFTMEELSAVGRVSGQSNRSSTASVSKNSVMSTASGGSSVFDASGSSAFDTPLDSEKQSKGSRSSAKERRELSEHRHPAHHVTAKGSNGRRSGWSREFPDEDSAIARATISFCKNLDDAADQFTSMKAKHAEAKKEYADAFKPAKQTNRSRAAAPPREPLVSGRRKGRSASTSGAASSCRSISDAVAGLQGLLSSDSLLVSGDIGNNTGADFRPNNTFSGRSKTSTRNNTSTAASLNSATPLNSTYSSARTSSNPPSVSAYLKEAQAKRGTKRREQAQVDCDDATPWGGHGESQRLLKNLTGDLDKLVEERAASAGVSTRYCMKKKRFVAAPSASSASAGKSKKVCDAATAGERELAKAQGDEPVCQVWASEVAVGDLVSRGAVQVTCFSDRLEYKVKNHPEEGVVDMYMRFCHYDRPELWKPSDGNGKTELRFRIGKDLRWFSPRHYQPLVRRGRDHCLRVRFQSAADAETFRKRCFERYVA